MLLWQGQLEGNPDPPYHTAPHSFHISVMRICSAKAVLMISEVKDACSDEFVSMAQLYRNIWTKSNKYIKICIHLEKNFRRSEQHSTTSQS